MVRDTQWQWSQRGDVAVIKQQKCLASAPATGVGRAGSSSNGKCLVDTVHYNVYYPEGILGTTMIFLVQMLPKLRIPPPRGPLDLVFWQSRAASASQDW